MLAALLLCCRLGLMNSGMSDDVATGKSCPGQLPRHTQLHLMLAGLPTPLLASVRDEDSRVRADCVVACYDTALDGCRGLHDLSLINCGLSRPPAMRCFSQLTSLCLAGAHAVEWVTSIHVMSHCRHSWNW